MELHIEKLVYGGEGLGRLEGRAVLLPLVLPGERVAAQTVKEEPRLVRARLGQVLEPSPARIAPQCVYFTRCGGCHYQHIGYEDQLRYKGVILAETLPVGTDGEDDGADSLATAVERHVNEQLADHKDDAGSADLYSRVMHEVERPLISLSLAATRGNQLKAATLLGVNRNTLRKKIRELDIQVVRGLK